MNPAAARRFPLVARPRPACTPLTQRVSDLHSRAATARQRGDVASATAVFNLAALLASDCGLPALARTWCHRLAAAAINHDHDPQHALEPIVNLARLHIRAGDGPAAWTLLETLFQAIETRTDVTIHGIAIPAARLTITPSSHAKARSWLWTVLLGTGAHALATAGRWDEASHRLNQYKGVGTRMLDGRQITVIAHTTAGRHKQARAMLATTTPGQPWENAVTACLYLHVPGDKPADLTTTARTAFDALGQTDARLTVFRTRLGLTLVDALDADYPEGDQIALSLLSHGGTDGYAARDLLAHTRCLSLASSRQVGQLTDLMAQCGLGLGSIPAAHLETLDHALDAAESVLAARSRLPNHQLT